MNAGLEFGKRVASEMSKKGITKWELEHKLCIGRGQVDALLNGSEKTLVRTLLKASKLLGLDVNIVLDRNDNGR